jgi:hypothetical protein
MVWTEVLEGEAKNPRARFEDELQTSAAYDSTAARMQGFVERGGGCRATFFNYLSKLASGSGTGPGSRPPSDRA